jgi:hypothetical protein
VNRNELTRGDHVARLLPVVVVVVVIKIRA